MRLLHGFTLIGAAFSLAVNIWAAPQKILNATDYGAKGDDTTLNTQAIQKAIDAVSLHGGTVTFDPGTYLTGSLFLKSNVTLDIPVGVTLVGSERLEDYPMLPTRMTWPA